MSVRWGILGAGNIAHRFAAALVRQEDASLVAISGRNVERLNAFASQFPVKRLYTTYDELLSDPEIDAVYISLPHDLHAYWAIQALKSHKAVLVEKPAAMNAKEVEQILAAAYDNHMLFMEAQKARFVPLYRELKKRVQSGAYGTLLRVETVLCNLVPSSWMRANNTYHYRLGVGGALLDSGTYCASILEDFCEGTPEIVRQSGAIQYGVDVYTKAELRFPSVSAMLETGFDRQKPRTARFVFEKAQIEINELHRPTKMKITTSDSEELVEIPYEGDDFYSEIRHFVSLMEKGATTSEIMPGEGSLRIAKILDLLRDNEQCYIEKPLTPDDLMTADDILEQERELSFSGFAHSDALGIGQEILNLVAQRKLPPVRIRVRYQDDIVFQYLMDGKTGDKWLNIKDGFVSKLGHSTWYAAKAAIEKDGEYRQLMRKQELLPVGGGFPLIVNGEICGAVIVSGLTDAEDHNLVVDALRAYLQKVK